MQNETLTGKVLSVRIHQKLEEELAEAMELAGIWNESDFVRQALVLRVREIKDAAQARKNNRTTVFTRRAKTEAGK